MANPGASVWTGIAAPAEWDEAELRLVQDKVVDLFDRFRAPLLRYLSGFNLPVHEGEEIVQEVFIALFRHLQKGKSEANLRAWIFRVGHNLALKRKERELPRAVRPDGVPDDLAIDESPNPETLAAANQTRRRLQMVIDALPDGDSRCLRLRAEGLRFREIADVLGISIGAVSQSLTRSITRLARVARS